MIHEKTRKSKLPEVFKQSSFSPLQELRLLEIRLKELQQPLILDLEFLLKMSGGYRFASEVEQYEFSQLLNTVLDRLGVKITAPNGEACKLYARQVRKGYRVFSLHNSQRGTFGGSRSLPVGLTTTQTEQPREIYEVS